MKADDVWKAFNKWMNKSPARKKWVMIIALGLVALLIFSLVPGWPSSNQSIFGTGNLGSLLTGKNLFNKTQYPGLPHLLKIKLNATTTPTLETYLCRYMISNNLENITIAGNVSTYNITFENQTNMTIYNANFGDVTCWRDRLDYDCLCITPIG